MAISSWRRITSLAMVIPFTVLMRGQLLRNILRTRAKESYSTIAERLRTQFEKGVGLCGSLEAIRRLPRT